MQMPITETKNMLLRRLRSAHRWEVTVAIVVAVLTYLLAARFDILEAIVRWARNHERWQVDELLTVSHALMVLFIVYVVRGWRRYAEANRALNQKNDELQMAMGEIKQLRGILPICASCKRIRDDKGYWHQVEVYIHEHTDAQFTHGLCPDCVKKLHPGIADRYFKHLE